MKKNLQLLVFTFFVFFSLKVNAQCFTPIMAGPTTPCQGLPSTYSGYAFMNPPPNSFTWPSASALAAVGALILDGGTTTDQFITIQWNQQTTFNVTLTATNGTNCTKSSQMAITVGPPAPTTFSGSGTVCAGTTVQYTGPTGMASYAWVVPGATIVGSSTGSTVQVAWNSNYPQLDLRLVAETTTGCHLELTRTITITTPTTPAISYTSYPQCLNVPNTFSTDSGKSNYTWTVSGGSIVSGQGTNSAVMIANSPGNYAVTVGVSYSTPGCLGTTSNSFTMPLTTGPSALLYGPIDVCKGAVTSYHTDFGMSNYTWSVGGGTIRSNDNAGTITVEWNTSGPVSVIPGYTVPSSGCYSSPYPTTVNVRDPYVPSISGNATVCVGVPSQYSTPNLSGTPTYNWTVSPDGAVSGGSASSSSVWYTWSTPGTKTITLNATSTTTWCPVPTTMTVTVIGAAAPTITGSPTACLTGQGNTAQGYSTISGMPNYSWTATNGTITTGTTPDQVTVSWTASGTQTLSVAYQNSNGCWSPAGSKTVTVSAPPTPSLTGPQNPCQYSTGNMYSTDPNKTGYVWSIPSGCTVTGGSVTSSSVTLTWDTYGVHPLLVTYTDPVTGCTGTSSVLAVNVKQGVQSATLIPNPTCLGPGNIYAGPPPIAGITSYSWAISPGGTITAGGTSTDSNVTVNWASTGPKWVSLNYVNTYGCTASTPTIANVTVHPTTTPTITGPVTTCSPGTAYTYNTETGNGESYYWWSVDSQPFVQSVDSWGGIWSAGNHTLRVKYTDRYSCQSAIGVTSITSTSGPASQTITFPSIATKTYGGAPFNLTATASSGLAVSYTSSNTSVATVSGSTVTIIGGGTSTITAVQAGANCISAAPNATQTLTVNKLNQTIAFGALPAKNFNNPAFTLGATASSGLPISYSSSNTAVATVSGTTVTIVGAGNTTITASQAGNANYNAATPVAQTLTVNKIGQTISFGALPGKIYGDPTFSLSATASSGLPVSFTSQTPTVATVSGTTVTIVGGGTATIVASQPGNANYNAATSVNQILTVNKASQTITFGVVPSVSCGMPPYDPGASSSAGLPITYTSSNTGVATVSGNIITVVAAGTSTITATQSGNGNYLAATSVQRTLTVNQASQTITFNPLPAKTYGDGAFTISASSTSGLGISFSSSNTSVATVSGNVVTIVAAGSTTITASQGGNACFAAASVGQTLTVNKAGQSISFSMAQTSFCGLGSTSLSATSATSGLNSISYSSSNTSVITISGTMANRVGYGDATITASQGGNGNYLAATDVPIPVHVYSTAGTITTSNGTNICHNSTTLTAGAGSGYSWNTGDTSQSLLISDVGTYTVNYVNTSGCTVSASITIIRSGTGCTNFRIAQTESDNTTNADFDPNHVFGISPNPADKTVLVVLSEVAKQDNFVEVYDMLGRSAKLMTIEKGLKEKAMNVEDLNVGIYLINIKDNIRERQRRLVIMRN